MISRVFFRIFVFGKFLGFYVSGKVFFWVVQKYPTPLIPVSRFAKPTSRAFLVVQMYTCLLSLLLPLDEASSNETLKEQDVTCFRLGFQKSQADYVIQEAQF